MKEKLKRFFNKLLSWKSFGMMSAGLMLLFIFISIVDLSNTHIMTAVFFFGYSALCARGHLEELMKEWYRMEAECHEQVANDAVEKCMRYRKLYGELPPEEEEKENNQDNQKKEE